MAKNEGGKRAAEGKQAPFCFLSPEKEPSQKSPPQEGHRAQGTECG